MKAPFLLPGDLRPVWLARQRFLAEMDIVAPQVWEDLRSLAVPLFRAGQRSKASSEILKWVARWRIGEGKLDDWASQFAHKRVRREAVLRQAGWVGGWVGPPLEVPDLPSRVAEAELYVVPAWNKRVETAEEFRARIDAHIEAVKAGTEGVPEAGGIEPLGRWYPELGETKADLRRRVSAHVGAIESELRKAGAKPARFMTELLSLEGESDRRTRRDLGRLVRFQILGMSFRSIAQNELEARRKREDYGERLRHLAVEVGNTVKRLAKFLGLPLREIKRGRPRKSRVS